MTSILIVALALCCLAGPSLAQKDAAWAPFLEARSTVRSLALRSEHAWKQWRSSEERLSKYGNIPRRPHEVYATDWVSLEDFLGIVPSTKSVTLSYFNIRGLGEPIRLLLAALQVNWTERSYERCPDSGCPAGVLDWAGAKEEGVASGSLPFGQMPRLEFVAADGEEFTVVQSRTITRFLAEEFGFGAEDRQVELLLDQVVGGAQDVRSRYGKLVYNPGWAGMLEEHQAFLDTWMPYFEALLGRHAGPYFAGAKLTYADVWVFDMLDSNLRIFPRLVQDKPKLAALLIEVSREPGVRAYLHSGRRRGYANGASAHFDTVTNPAPALHEELYRDHDEL